MSSAVTVTFKERENQIKSLVLEAGGKKNSYQGTLVDQKLDLNDGTRRLSIVTNMSIYSWLTQAENEQDEKSLFVTF